MYLYQIQFHYAAYMHLHVLQWTWSQVMVDFVQWRLDYCYSLHYLRFQKTPTICSCTPLEFTAICEQRFLLWQILDSIHKIFLGKNDPCFDEFSFEIPRFRQ
jgi:hypothetical protein